MESGGQVWSVGSDSPHWSATSPMTTDNESNIRHRWLADIRGGLDAENGNGIIILGQQGVAHIHCNRRDIDNFLAEQKSRIKWQGRLYQLAVLCLVCVIGVLSTGVYQKTFENILASEQYAKLKAERDAIEEAFSLYTEMTRDIVGEHHEELSARVGELGANTRSVVNAIASSPGTGGLTAPTKGSVRLLSEHIDSTTARNLHEIARVQEFFDHLPLNEPVEASRVTSSFGMREHPITGRVQPHRGIDLVSWENPTVFSSGAGRVTFAAKKGRAGNMVTIDHGSSVESRYFHLDSIAVEVGDVLGPGDVVGVMGETGFTSGIHLHYEVRVAGKSLDPAKVFDMIGYAE
ncbi:peptidoglycan DD-metalloendopeptidase family protein [Spiribacter sp. 2438]|nr:peptidoglycan DD-metalloendopeptidase family protein [Spiribacter sp. 2438]